MSPRRKAGKQKKGRQRGGKRPRTTNGGDTRGHARPDACGTLKISRRGYGFVTTAEGDYYISRKHLFGAMDGDTVLVRPSRGSGGDRKRGRIVSVLNRATQVVIGRYEANGALGVVIPLDPRISFDIFTDATARPDLHTGDVVSVHITTYPARNVSAFGTVEEKVGHEGDRDLGQTVLIWRYGLETEFSEGAGDAASTLELDVDSALSEPGRKDLRDRFIFTIDPPDARDFDDAISVERMDQEDGSSSFLRLGVHIADVSHYVAWNSSIDLDARRRATSVYLADRVIPMLPEVLSNGICSLNPDEDRLAFSVEMVLDRDGNLLSSEFFPSVIRSRMRLDYERVQEFICGTTPWPEAPSPFEPGTLEREITDLVGLAAKRREMRRQRGGIDFDSVEPKVILDDEGRVERIVLRRRTEATGAIEEAMILANETVATYLQGHASHMVYRVHDKPSQEALYELVPLLEELGYPTAGLLDLSSGAIERVLEIAQDRPEKDLVFMKVLRSMKRAVYSTVNIGHFGLASECYCHFTSPIRRYPDLIVHRLLHAQLAGRTEDGASEVAGMVDQLDWLCSHSSEMERIAADAAFDSVQMKLCEYMAQRVGEVFPGIVTGVSTAGLMVTLPTTARGLVPIRSLGDEYFDYDVRRMTLVGDDTKTTYHIGQQVRVRVTGASPRDMTIDFELA